MVAMVTVLTNFVPLVSDLGLNAALIQRRTITRKQLSTVFWLNLTVCAAAFLAFAAGRHSLARFYGVPELSPFVAVVPLTFLIDSLVLIKRSSLLKALDFKRLSIVEGLAIAISSTAAVTLALKGFGAWSLVALYLVLSSVSACLLVLLDRGIPAGSSDNASVNSLLPFGLATVGVRTLTYWSSNADNLLVGMLLGASTLGVYAAAFSLFYFPIQCITLGLSRVLFPALSLIQHDTVRLKNVYLRAAQAVALVTFPTMLGLLVVAEPLVLAVFGAKWSAMVPLLRIFSVAGLVGSVALESTVLSSLGRANLRLRIEGFCRLNLLAGIAIGVSWGVRGVAIGFTLASLVNWFPLVATARRRLGFSINEYVGHLAPPLACAAVMAVLTWVFASQLPPHWPPVATLLACVSVGAATYGTLVAMLKPPAFSDIRWLLLQRPGKPPEMGTGIVFERGPGVVS